MRAQSHARPVRGLFGVRHGVAVFNKRAQKFVNEMRMRTAVPRALREAQMSFFSEIINTFRREWLAIASSFSR